MPFRRVRIPAVRIASVVALGICGCRTAETDPTHDLQPIPDPGYHAPAGPSVPQPMTPGHGPSLEPVPAPGALPPAPAESRWKPSQDVPVARRVPVTEPLESQQRYIPQPRAPREAPIFTRIGGRMRIAIDKLRWH